MKKEYEQPAGQLPRVKEYRKLTEGEKGQLWDKIEAGKPIRQRINGNGKNGLSPEEERMLDVSDEALWQVVEGCRGLNALMAISIFGPFIFESYEEDLLQVGRGGLVKAALTYDRSKGVAFSTWAVSKLRGEFQRDELGRSGFLGYGKDWRRMRMLAEIAGFEDRYEKEHDKKPGIEEICEETGLSKLVVTRVLRERRMSTMVLFSELQEMLQRGRGDKIGSQSDFLESVLTTHEENAESERGVEELAINQINATIISKSLELLPARTEWAVRLRAGLSGKCDHPLFNREVGELLGLTGEMVRLILSDPNVGKMIRDAVEKVA